MKNKTGRLLALILGFVLVMTIFPIRTFARELVETDRKCTLTLKYDLRNIKFSLYKVAVINASGELSLTGAFADYQVSLEQDQEGWQALAETLEAYVLRDNIAPTATETTNSGGEAVFNDLAVGLYLVLGEEGALAGITVTPQPFLICLPNLYDESEPWVYDVTADVKYSYRHVDEEDGKVKRKVLKVWDDGNRKDKRPESIAVQLLCDGEVFDTVILDESNNWSYTWTDLSDKHIWRVVEKEVPEGYTVIAEQRGITFVITNSTSGTPPYKPPEEPKELPQTGMLWWPVGILSACGIGLILIGALRRRKEYGE